MSWFAAMCLTLLAWFANVSVPDMHFVADLQGQRFANQCMPQPETSALPDSLRLLVWNVYKQQGNDFYDELNHLSHAADLLLLQEVVTSSAWNAWSQSWQGRHSAAFQRQQRWAGVATLGKFSAAYVCGFWRIEPWLGTPKSALVSRYRLANGQQLLVVNIHAVNFEMGISAYQAQFRELATVVGSHSGAVIWAGDFNSWSRAREAVLSEQLLALGLRQVEFPAGERANFAGRPLDHVWLRGVKLKSAAVIPSENSDHNALYLELAL